MHHYNLKAQGRTASLCSVFLQAHTHKKPQTKKTPTKTKTTDVYIFSIILFVKRFLYVFWCLIISIYWSDWAKKAFNKTLAN